MTAAALALSVGFLGKDGGADQRVGIVWMLWAAGEEALELTGKVPEDGTQGHVARSFGDSITKIRQEWPGRGEKGIFLLDNFGIRPQ